MDNDLETVHEMTDTEIADEVQAKRSKSELKSDTEELEEIEEDMPLPSTSQLVSSFKVVRAFLLKRGLNLTDSFQKAEKEMHLHCRENKKQLTISDFFKKQ